MKKSIGITLSAIGAGFYASAVTMLFMRGEDSYGMTMLLIALGICCSSLGKTVRAYEMQMIEKKELRSNGIYVAVVFLCFLLIIGVYSVGIYNGHEPSELLPNLAFPVALIFIGMFVYRFQFTKDAMNSMITSISDASKKGTKPHFLNSENRRYSLVVRSVHTEGRQVEVEGEVHGTIRVKDTVYVYSPSSSHTSTVTSLTANGLDTQSAADCRVKVTLSKGNVEEYNVLSSVEKGKMPHENPLLKGLLYEYGELKGDPSFLSVFMKVLVHSTFVVPVLMETSEQIMEKSMKIGFMAVNRTVNGMEEKTFAVFTDGDALTKWKDLFKDGKHPVTLNITFQDAVQLMSRGHSGIVINAFGPKFVYLPKEMIDLLTRQEEYRKEFGDTKGLSFEPKDHR